MKSKTLIGLLILILLVLGGLQFTKITFPAQFADYKQFTPTNNIQEFPLPFLLFSNATPKLILAQKAAFKKYNYSGFIISSLPSNWHNEVSDLKTHYWECLRLNWHFKENYLRIALGENELPRWDETEQWVSINNKIRTIAKFARQTGFKGICLDTKCYNPAVWNPAFEKYKNLSDNFARNMIYQQGRTMMHNIKSVFPNATIIVYPAGLFTQPKEKELYHPYYYWIHFFNGLLSKSETTQIILLTDNCTELSQENSLSGFLKYSENQLNSELDYPKLWFKNNFLAFVSWPLGKWDDSKEMILDPKTFLNQLFLFQKYSQKYIVIFAKGQAWWQTENGAALGLDENIAKIPQTKYFAEYVSALQLFKTPLLKFYFKQQLNNKNFSVLEYSLSLFKGVFLK